MTLPLTVVPAPSLHEPSKKLTKEEILSDEIQSLIADMIPTMYAEHGIGLAAPQVGKNVQICVIGKDAVPEDMILPEGASDLVLINPTITRGGRRTFLATEGCLSVPGKHGKIKRYRHIRLEALDRYGNPIVYEGVNRTSHDFAHVVQHEVDHLHSTLYIDKAQSVWDIEPSS